MFRPLPRGLIKYDEVITVINMVLAAMSLYAGMLAWRFTLSVGLTFGLQVNHLFVISVLYYKIGNICLFDVHRIRNWKMAGN